jgi:hypothetical protein
VECNEIRVQIFASWSVLRLPKLYVFYQDIFQTVLSLTFLYGIKLMLIPDGEKSGNYITCGFFNIAHYNFM